jgi:hypothetical protein
MHCMYVLSKYGMCHVSVAASPVLECQCLHSRITYSTYVHSGHLSTKNDKLFRGNPPLFHVCRYTHTYILFTRNPGLIWDQFLTSRLCRASLHPQRWSWPPGVKLSFWGEDPLFVRVCSPGPGVNQGVNNPPREYSLPQEAKFTSMENLTHGDHFYSETLQCSTGPGGERRGEQSPGG